MWLSTWGLSAGTGATLQRALESVADQALPTAASR
jgi:hypothetical protein